MRRWSGFIKVISAVIISLLSISCGINMKTESSYGPATFSPDGQTLVFSYFDAKIDKEYLYKVRLNGDNKPIRVTQATSGYERNPTISPDGKLLAYEFHDPRDANKSNIYIANSDGSDSRRLCDDSCFYASPVFSSNSKTIYFVRLERHEDGIKGHSQHESDLFAVNVDGSHLRRITNYKFYECSRNPMPLSKPALSPDGETLVLRVEPYEVKRKEMTSDFHLLESKAGRAAAVKSEGSKLLQMKNSKGGDSSLWLCHISNPAQLKSICMPNAVNFYTNECYDPCFTPDGKSLIFTAASDGDKGFVYEIYRLDLVNSQIKQLTNLHEYLSALQSSPSGKTIIFLSAGPSYSNQKSLYRLNLDSGVITQLHYFVTMNP